MQEMWPEVLPSFIIIASCITITGLGLKYVDRWQNGGKVCHKHLSLARQQELALA